MYISSSVLIVDPIQKSRESLLQAIHYQRIVNHITSYRSLDEALIAIRNRKKADIVLVSTRFPQRELAEFINAAKQTPDGRDGAYLMIFDESVDKLAIAKCLIDGTDGFIIAPFSADGMQSAIKMAEKIRLQNMLLRIRTAAQQVIDVLKDEISHVARDKALGKKGSFRSVAHDAADILRTFVSEEREVYFDLLLKTFEQIPPPVPVLGRTSSFIGNVDITVEELIEALKSPHARMRATAAKIVASLGNKAKCAIPYLIGLLEDSNSLCRHRAKVALDIIDPHGNLKDFEADDLDKTVEGAHAGENDCYSTHH